MWAATQPHAATWVTRLQPRTCSCPLQTLEASLLVQHGYERLKWRGFSAPDVWRLLTLVQLNLRSRPRQIGHLRVPRGAEVELALPYGHARCLLVVHLLAQKHVFFSQCKHSWPRAVETLWQEEGRAVRTQCRRTKCAL